MDRTVAPTGETVHALNLGSYNYLGFASKDSYCTPRVLDALDAWGVSTCSARPDAGTYAVHGELEREIAAFVGKEAAVVYGMGFATNAASIPAIAGRGTLVRL